MPFPGLNPPAKNRIKQLLDRPRTRRRKIGNPSLPRRTHLSASIGTAKLDSPGNH